MQSSAMMTMIVFGQIAGLMRPPVSTSMRAAAQNNSAAATSMTAYGSTCLAREFIAKRSGLLRRRFAQRELAGHEAGGVLRGDEAVGEGELVHEEFPEVLGLRASFERIRENRHLLRIGSRAHDDRAELADGDRHAILVREGDGLVPDLRLVGEEEHRAHLLGIE